MLGISQLLQHGGSFLGAVQRQALEEAWVKGEMLESPQHTSWFPVKCRQTARDLLP